MGVTIVLDKTPKVCYDILVGVETHESWWTKEEVWMRVTVPILLAPPTTIEVNSTETAMLKVVGGMARTVANAISEVYEWTQEDRDSVQKVLSDMYRKLSGPVFNDRRRE